VTKCCFSDFKHQIEKKAQFFVKINYRSIVVFYKYTAKILMRAIDDIQEILESHKNMVSAYQIKNDGNQCLIDVNVIHPCDQDSYEELESLILQIQWHIIHELQNCKAISFTYKVTLFKSEITWQKDFCMNQQNTLHVTSYVHPFFLQFDDIIKQLT